MHTEKTLFIKELQPGQEVELLCLISNTQQSQARNGLYWRLELKDKSGILDGKIWSPLSLDFKEIPAGTFALLQGKVSTFKDKLDLNIESLKILPQEEINTLDLSLFLPCTERKPELLFADLLELCQQNLNYNPWRNFIFEFLNDQTVKKQILFAPAAKSIHHAYCGGLLEHTLSVSRLCLKLTSAYPWVDKQVLLVGAVCHDLGKAWELNQGISFDYTLEGRLLGHIFIILEKLEPFLRNSELPEQLQIHLKHLILSHHGELEYGAAKVPQSAEAMLLHFSDNIDAKMAQIQTALSNIPDGTSGWSSYQNSLDRFLYKAVPTPAQDYPKDNHSTQSYPENANIDIFDSASKANKSSKHKCNVRTKEQKDNKELTYLSLLGKH